MAKVLVQRSASDVAGSNRIMEMVAQALIRILNPLILKTALKISNHSPRSSEYHRYDI